MKRIVSNPRYGSTHVTDYYNSLQANENTIEFEGFTEFLLPPSTWREHKFDKITIEEKVAMLEHYRKEGKEILFKCHAWHLFQTDWLYDWYMDFYKDDEIIVLKRKDLWRAYLSLCVHFRHRYWHKKPGGMYDFDKMPADDIVMDNFFYQLECINKVKGEVIYLEDLDIETDSLKWDVDYESLYDRDVLEKMREEFNARST